MLEKNFSKLAFGSVGMIIGSIILALFSYIIGDSEMVDVFLISIIFFLVIICVLTFICKIIYGKGR